LITKMIFTIKRSFAMKI